MRKRSQLKIKVEGERQRWSVARRRREPEGRGQIGELRGARAARPGSAYHEKITADHSRLLPFRLSYSRPDSARRHHGAVGTGIREQGRDQRHVRNPIEPTGLVEAG